MSLSVRIKKLLNEDYYYSTISDLRNDSKFLSENPEYTDSNAKYMKNLNSDRVKLFSDNLYRIDITVKPIPLNFNSGEDLIDKNEILKTFDNTFDFDIDRVTSESKKNIKDPDKMPYDLRRLKEIGKKLGCKETKKANIIACIQKKYYGEE